MQEAILAHYLSTGFLWEQVRMKGGAYGAGASVSSLERVFTFTSYRDPNIVRTFDSFRQALDSARGEPPERRGLRAGAHRRSGQGGAAHGPRGARATRR